MGEGLVLNRLWAHSWPLYWSGQFNIDRFFWWIFEEFDHSVGIWLMRNGMGEGVQPIKNEWNPNWQMNLKSKGGVFHDQKKWAIFEECSI